MILKKVSGVAHPPSYKIYFQVILHHVQIKSFLNLNKYFISRICDDCNFIKTRNQVLLHRSERNRKSIFFWTVHEKARILRVYTLREPYLLCIILEYSERDRM